MVERQLVQKCHTATSLEASTRRANTHSDLTDPSSLLDHLLPRLVGYLLTASPSLLSWLLGGTASRLMGTLTTD